MNPDGRMIGHLDGENERDDDVADDQHGKIWRRVVGLMVMQIFAAGRTGIGDLEISVEEPAAAALGAAPEGATQSFVGNRS